MQALKIQVKTRISALPASGRFQLIPEAAAEAVLTALNHFVGPFDFGLASLGLRSGQALKAHRFHRCIVKMLL